MFADTISNGSAPSMNTTLPSGRRATPCPSMSSASTASQPSGSAGFVTSSVMRGIVSAPGFEILAPVRLAGRKCAERLLDERDLLLVFAFGEAAAHLLEAAIQQVGVHHVRLAVAADVLELALRERLVHLGAVHPELARKAAQLRHRIQRRVVLRLVLPQ